MGIPDRYKSRYFLETIHIPLWLVKDICWLMEYRTLGIIIAVPTILVAFIMCGITYKERDHFLPNVSIAFWIVANANWMVAEFYRLETKSLSIYPFLLGVLAFVIFVFIKLIDRKKTEQNS